MVRADLPYNKTLESVASNLLQGLTEKESLELMTAMQFIMDTKSSVIHEELPVTDADGMRRVILRLKTSNADTRMLLTEIAQIGNLFIATVSDPHHPIYSLFPFEQLGPNELGVKIPYAEGTELWFEDAPPGTQPPIQAFSYEERYFEVARVHAGAQITLEGMRSLKGRLEWGARMREASAAASKHVALRIVSELNRRGTDIFTIAMKTHSSKENSVVNNMALRRDLAFAASKGRDSFFRLFALTKDTLASHRKNVIYDTLMMNETIIRSLNLEQRTSDYKIMGAGSIMDQTGAVTEFQGLNIVAMDHMIDQFQTNVACGETNVSQHCCIRYKGGRMAVKIVDMTNNCPSTIYFQDALVASNFFNVKKPEHEHCIENGLEETPERVKLDNIDDVRGYLVLDAATDNPERFLPYMFSLQFNQEQGGPFQSLTDLGASHFRHWQDDLDPKDQTPRGHATRMCERKNFTPAAFLTTINHAFKKLKTTDFDVIKCGSVRKAFLVGENGENYPDGRYKYELNRPFDGNTPSSINVEFSVHFDDVMSDEYIVGISELDNILQNNKALIEQGLEVPPIIRTIVKISNHSYRIFALAYAMLPVTYNSFSRLELCGLPPCIDIAITRVSEFVTNNAIILRKGRSTAINYFQYPIYSEVKTQGTAQQTAHIIFYHGLAILDPKAVVVLPDIAIRDSSRGTGTKWIMRTPYGYNSIDMSILSSGDIGALLIPPESNLNDHPVITTYDKWNYRISSVADDMKTLASVFRNSATGQRSLFENGPQENSVSEEIPFGESELMTFWELKNGETWELGHMCSGRLSTLQNLTDVGRVAGLFSGRYSGQHLQI